MSKRYFLSASDGDGHIGVVFIHLDEQKIEVMSAPGRDAEAHELLDTLEVVFSSELVTIPTCDNDNNKVKVLQ
jgi:hypothetical protein